ncbi:MAG: nucleotidyltransferase [Oscillospiraceae bacterium]
MKIGGIIAEYNPFHNGHRYQIETFKKEYNITHVVVVMSGNFVQRGDLSIIDKFQRSKMAILNGVDLILELPVCYSLSSAEFFANGGISILNDLNCIDTLSFGSTSDIDTLKYIAKVSEEVRTSNRMLELIKSGMTFPMALSQLMKDYSHILNEPNNVLGLEYIRALNRLNSNIEPTTITRKHVQHHSSIAIDDFASASHIRSLIYGNHQEFKKYLPIWKDDFPITKLENLEQAILYKLRTSTIEEIQSVADVSQGLEYRIYQCGRKANNLNELLFEIKSKRYTLSRVRRIVLNLLLGISKKDILTPPPYARILALNHKGIEILSKAKKTSKIPIDTSLARLQRVSPICERFATLESHATDIYNLSFNDIYPCGTDYTQKIVPYD